MHQPRPAAAPQRFATSYAQRSPFTPKGLRSFWEYRDLGMADATHGAWKATVLRARGVCPPGGTGWHHHALEFQMYYLLAGTMQTEVEGQGESTFGPGDSFMQPPHTWHNVVHFSEDLEMLEVVAPADFGTVEGDPGEAPPLSPTDADSPRQAFTISRAQGAAFETGLRSYFAYRDLHTAAGSRGRVQAHVLRAEQPCPPEGTGWHHHVVDFQLIYVLSGSITTELEGQGVLTFRAGDAWLQPPGIRHCVRDYSSDLAQIEIVSPADFGTVDSPHDA